MADTDGFALIRSIRNFTSPKVRAPVVLVTGAGRGQGQAADRDDGPGDQAHHQHGDRGDDPDGVAADQFHRSARNALRPLGRIAQHEHAFAERHRLDITVVNVALPTFQTAFTGIDDPYEPPLEPELVIPGGATPAPAAALPPEDPPGTRPESHGLSTGP